MWLLIVHLNYQLASVVLNTVPRAFLVHFVKDVSREYTCTHHYATLPVHSQLPTPSVVLVVPATWLTVFRALVCTVSVVFQASF